MQSFYADIILLLSSIDLIYYYHARNRTNTIYDYTSCAICIYIKHLFDFIRIVLGIYYNGAHVRARMKRACRKIDYDIIVGLNYFDT